MVGIHGQTEESWKLPLSSVFSEWGTTGPGCELEGDKAGWKPRWKKERHPFVCLDLYPHSACMSRPCQGVTGKVQGFTILPICQIPTYRYPGKGSSFPFLADDRQIRLLDSVKTCGRPTKQERIDGRPRKLGCFNATPMDVASSVADMEDWRSWQSMAKVGSPRIHNPYSVWLIGRGKLWTFETAQGPI